MLFILDKKVMFTRNKYTLYDISCNGVVDQSDGVWVMDTDEVTITHRDWSFVHENIGKFAASKNCFVSANQYLMSRDLCFGDMMLSDGSNYRMEFTNGSRICIFDNGKIYENDHPAVQLMFDPVKWKFDYLYRLKKYLIARFKVFPAANDGKGAFVECKMVLDEKSGSLRCMWSKALREPYAVDYAELSKIQTTLG